MFRRRLARSAAVLLCAVAASAQSPRATIEADSWSFGLVEEGTTHARDLAVTNLGDAPLEIRRIDPGCGCIQARLFRLEIAPGESAPLHLSLDTTGREGALGKTVILRTNDPSMPELRVLVTGLIRRRLWFTTPAWDIGRMEAGGDAPTVAVLELAPGQAGTLVHSEVDLPGATVEAAPFGEPDASHGFRFRLRFAADAPVGRVEGRLLVRLDAPIPLQRHLPIRGEILGPYDVRPERLAFGRLSPGDKKTLAVSVRRRDGAPMDFARIDLPDPRLEARRIVASDPALIAFEITLVPRAGDTDLRGRLSIHARAEGESIPPFDFDWYAQIRR